MRRPARPTRPTSIWAPGGVVRRTSSVGPRSRPPTSCDVKGAHTSQHDLHEPDWSNFAGFLAEVSVDRESGAYTLHDLLLVADTGTIINPVAHRGQLAGGVVFGIGSGVTEELVVESGKIVNLNL